MNINTPRMNLSSLVAGGVVATVAIVIISAFALKSLFGKLSINNQLLSKKNAAHRQIKENLEALQNLSSEYDALADRKTLIFDALPTTSNFPSIVSMMESLSKDAGVKLLSVAPSEDRASARATGPEEYEYSASISGRYSSFKAFLTNIEKSVRPLAITTMKISGSSDALSVDMTILTHFQKEYDTTLATEPLKKSSRTGASSNNSGNTQ